MISVLWITRFYSWTFPLMDEISKNVELCIINPEGNSEEKYKKNGITFYNLGLDSSYSVKNMTRDLSDKYIRIINDFKPQIIHVHGTEYNFAQIQKFVPTIPVVVSIQGILGGYIHFTKNYLERKDILPYTTIKNILGRGGYDLIEKKCISGSNEFEKEILETSKYFFCRTDWDHAWVSFTNPKAIIYQGEELLRDAFYEYSGHWNIAKCNRFTVFMTAGFSPIKGLHVAIKAIILLKKLIPNVLLVVPGLPAHILNYGKIKSRIIGEEYINYIKRLIKSNDLRNNIKLLPQLNDEEMAKEMLNANVFLSPSSIDNSPNAVGEAMLIGTPIVTTPVGGIPSMLRDGISCLFAPAGDEYMIAYQLKRIFEDDVLAEKLSKAAYETALHRHNKEKTKNQYLESYQCIIDNHIGEKNENSGSCYCFQ